MQTDLSGPREWWTAVRSRLETEADKMRAFMDAVGEFRQRLAARPGIRARVVELRELVGELEADDPRRAILHQRVRSLEAQQGDIDGAAVRLMGRITSLLSRSHTEKESIDEYGDAGYGEAAELGAFFLVAGISVALVAGTAAIVAWLIKEAAHLKEVQQVESIVDMAAVGEITPAGAAEMLRAIKPGPLVGLSAGGMVGGGALLAVAALFLLPRMMKRGR